MTNHAIYAIRHKDTNKLYIVSSINYVNRWNIHRWHLNRGTHHSRYLQRCWDKHGADAFEFMIVHMVEEDHELLDWEQFWLDKLKPVFNSSPTAGNTLGFKFSEESKRRIANARRGTKASPETRAKLSEMRKGMKQSPEAIRKSAEGRRGFRHTDEAKRKMGDAARGRKRDPATLENQRAAVSKTYKVISPDGVEQIITNMAGFCRENNLTATNMSRVAMGKLPHHKRWKCELLDGTG